MQNSVLVVDEASIPASFDTFSLYVNDQHILDTDRPIKEVAENLAKALECEVTYKRLSAESLASFMAEQKGRASEFACSGTDLGMLDDWTQGYTAEDVLQAIKRPEQTYRVFDIQWDQDDDDDNDLPTEMLVTVDDEDLIGDRISDIVGYCHFGFNVECT